MSDRRRALLAPLLVTIAVHLALLGAQAGAAIVTGSVAIGANALHLGIDSVIHAVALIGAVVATRPPNERHPYGYDRVEAVTSFVIGLLLLVVVVLIAAAAIPRLFDPLPARSIDIGLAVMSVSAIATGSLAYYLSRSGRRLASRIVHSESVHTLADTSDDHRRSSSRGAHRSRAPAVRSDRRARRSGGHRMAGNCGRPRCC